MAEEDQKEKISKKGFKIDWKYTISTLIALTAVIITIIVNAKSCNKESNQDALNFRKLAAEYRPTLEVKEPIIKNVIFKLDPKIFLYNIKHSKIPDYNFIIQMSTGKYVDIDFYIHNKGNSQAKIIFYELFDSVYNNKLILEQIDKGIHYPKVYYNMEFQNAAIDKDFTYRFNAKCPILNPRGENVTFHFLLVYKNDLGIIYNTYCWFRYKLIYPNFLSKIKMIPKNIQGLIKLKVLSI